MIARVGGELVYFAVTVPFVALDADVSLLVKLVVILAGCSEVPVVGMAVDVGTPVVILTNCSKVGSNEETGVTADVFSNAISVAVGSSLSSEVIS